ncbi:hypothetical protein IMZ48_18105 [Candidatus Bathyarchaeota archaeon]|nr:hypothetical protein [Candidatus Bathyarchaeota archaeon]
MSLSPSMDPGPVSPLPEFQSLLTAVVVVVFATIAAIFHGSDGPWSP